MAWGRKLPFGMKDYFSIYVIFMVSWIFSLAKNDLKNIEGKIFKVIFPNNRCWLQTISAFNFKVISPQQITVRL